MPPQSRGTPSERGAFNSGPSVPPTLRPYLENLPSPTALIADQSTPTGPSFNVAADRDVSTPTRHPRLEPTSDDEADDVTLDDDDFQSHYSRHSSPASSSSSVSEEDEDEEANAEEQNGYARQAGSLQRISSLPVAPAHSQHAQSQLHTSQSTTSLPPPPPLPLYPPFYNRPPTPLPPSPSLTSLLRPPSLLNRSTTSTRPTTPDSSDVETPNDTEAAVAHSARRAHPLPPTSPKVPTYEYYGFVLYLASSLAFLIYILWSYLPSPFLHALGITYYPNRWWSLAIPAWIVMVLVYIYVALLSYNVEYLTLPLTSLECMVDDAGSVAILDEMGRVRKGGSKRFVTEMEIRRKREEEKRWRMSSGTGSKGRASKRKEREREKHREREEDWYGYLGDYGKGVEELNWSQIWNEGTDAVMDIPIGGVCEVLYGED